MPVSNGMIDFICKHEAGRSINDHLEQKHLNGINLGDAGGHKTYGWGLLYHPDGGFMDQKKTKWTEEELRSLCIKSINKKAQKVEQWASGLNLKQYQIDALVSLCYNFGEGVLNGSKCGGVCKLIKQNPNNPQIKYIWEHGSDAQGARYPGLLKRRKLEAAWYFGVTTGDMSLSNSDLPEGIGTNEHFSCSTPREEEEPHKLFSNLFEIRKSLILNEYVSLIANDCNMIEFIEKLII